MKPWFTIDKIDDHAHIISEYRHWEETHCYLLEGKDRALLIDTGLGICDISAEVKKLTDKSVTAVATHIHWDHIGGLKYYPDFYPHAEELNWLSGGFPLVEYRYDSQHGY
jgi:glyoxylase-like metal-dependent hydrolase (beta-lactamase superfamily II)